MIEICDSCLTAVYDEGGQGLSKAEQVLLARTMGAEVADHICDAREEGEACGCACRASDSE